MVNEFMNRWNMKNNRHVSSIMKLTYKTIREYHENQKDEYTKSNKCNANRLGDSCAVICKNFQKSKNV